jgi:hypothetical protein
VKARARLSVTGALVFGLTLGCQASVNADANVSGKGASAEADADLHGSASAEAEGKGEMSRSSVAPAAGDRANSVASLGASRVLLGARHDLKLRPGKATASCECLAVALGGAHGAGMLWSAAPADIDESTQLSIALSSEGQACKDEPKKSLGASYWGYRIAGNDVVVLVEAARDGRPLTTGAIIPRPVGQGQVYVAPAQKKLPYGRPLSGTGQCKVGNPGPVRSTPFTELELGQDAPSASGTRGTRERAISDHSNDDTPTTIEMPSN